MRIGSSAWRALLLIAWLQGLAPAHALTFMVTNTDDDGSGSLRQAIVDANVDSDPDVIEFSIGTGLQTIAPASALPNVTNPVTIDGTTQPGFAGTPLIEIDGTSVPAGLSGLVLAGHTGSTIKGFVINRFAVDVQIGGNAILLSGGGGHTITGNYLGTDPTGTIARPNGRYGVACNGCTGCTIGGTTAAARNLLSGNGTAGILVRDGTDNVIQGNWIGLAASGTDPLENGDGIFMLTGSSGSQDNLIGGSVPGAGNVISSNGNGITIGNSSTSGNIVQGNLIGSDPTGTVLIGNGLDGISINGAPSTTIDGNVIVGSSGAGINIRNLAANDTIVRDNHIGVDAAGSMPMPNDVGIRVSFSASGAPQDTTIGGAGQGNVIAHNTGDGIIVVSGTTSPTGVDIQENRIFANGGLGIDLENDGVTDNDAGDDDAGANGLQNFPLVTGVTDLGDTTEFTGTLDAAADTQYRVELFASTSADPSGNGEGESPLGTATVLSDGTGHADLVIELPVTVDVGSFVTATATDPDGNTSELSPVFQVTAPTTSTTSTSTTTSSSSSTEEPTTTTTSTDPPTTSTVAPTTTTSSTAEPTTTTSSTLEPTTTTSSTVEPTTTTSSTATPTSTTSSTVAPTTTTSSTSTTSSTAMPSTTSSTIMPTTTTSSTSTTSSTATPTSTTSSTVVPTTTTSTTVANTTTTSSSTSSTVVASTTSSTTTTEASSSTMPSSTSSTSTSTSTSSTTPTTLPPCSNVAKKPIELVSCRVDLLATRVDEEAALGVVQAKLATRLDLAMASLDQSRAACETRQTRRAKRGLGKAGRALAQVMKTLRSRKARDVPAPLRTELTAAATAVKDDVTLVKAGIVCP